MSLKSILLVSALGLVGAANAAPLAVWNFNDAGPSGTNSAANTAALFAVDRKDAGVSAAALSSNFEAAYIVNFAGTTVGANNGDAASQALALQGGTASTTTPTTYANNGRYLDISLSAAAGSTLSLTSLTFAAQRTGTGFTTQAFSYSTDNGATFTALSSLSGFPSAFAAQTLDLSAINNVSSVVIRNTFTGTTSATGNNRIDNLVVNGSVQAVPEPASMAALGLGAVAMLRRRRAAK